jgi:pimeloyl-ACP methyl ester carboxylesterase
MACISPLTTLFSDLPTPVAETWLATLQPQPAEGWNDTITYGAWKDVPSIYLLAEEDKVLPSEIQEQCATLAGSEVVRVKAGHMLMLNQPDKCLEVILGAVAGLG